MIEAPFVVGTEGQARHPALAAIPGGVLVARTDGAAGGMTTVGIRAIAD
jgi:hypothetical protein